MDTNARISPASSAATEQQQKKTYIESVDKFIENDDKGGAYTSEAELYTSTQVRIYHHGRKGYVNHIDVVNNSVFKVVDDLNLFQSVRKVLLDNKETDNFDLAEILISFGWTDNSVANVKIEVFQHGVHVWTVQCEREESHDCSEETRKRVNEWIGKWRNVFDVKEANKFGKVGKSFWTVPKWIVWKRLENWNGM